MSELLLPRGFSSEVTSGQDAWVELASRTHDGIVRILHTLGEKALADTPAKVDVFSESFEIHEEGPLSEVAPIYLHPTLYVSSEEAQAQFSSPLTREE
jgi:hypothetical protein